MRPRRGHDGEATGLDLRSPSLRLRLLLPLCLLAWSASTPAQPPRIDDWVPRDWWTPVQFVTGGLNGDDFDDIAVVLERQRDAPEDPRFERGSLALMILFGTEAGRWRLGPMVPGMLPCTVCSDRLSGGQESALYDLSISDDGVLEIGWVQKGAGMKAVRLFIGWDNAYQGVGLLADDVALIRPAPHGRTRVKRDYRAGMLWIDGEPRSMPPRFIPIEDVSAEQY